MKDLHCPPSKKIFIFGNISLIAAPVYCAILPLILYLMFWPPLTLDKLELGHTQRLLLVFMFIQTSRPASSVLPVGYLALSPSTLSLSSQDRTQQVTQIILLIMCDGMFDWDMHD